MFDLPETNRICKEVISIPVHPSLSEENLEKIVTEINSMAEAGS
jgi:dTDP-4-amino-4,6-dideoxygalactose transaminase